MLRFARKGDSRFSFHSIESLLDNAIELASTDYIMKKQCDFKNISIHKDYATDTPTIFCEESEIQQVLLNIFRNGAEAMKEAGVDSPAFVLSTMYDPQKQMVSMMIEDNGPGMDGETHKRLFDPFFTTKPAGGGMGLGLSASYLIITENHSGEISVETQPGEGAKFIIALPVDRRSQGRS
jgi:signal transduction histidine kinase